MNKIQGVRSGEQQKGGGGREANVIRVSGKVRAGTAEMNTRKGEPEVFVE